MAKKVRRNIFKNIFLNYEKEETWLNTMCIQGYALCEISNGYYLFEECKPGEFLYSIEFLKEGMNSQEKSSYLDFIQEMDIDHIANINRWQYFRRKAVLGKFNIYSDIDSKIKHYQRINIVWYMLSVPFIISGFSGVTNFITSNFFDIDIDWLTLPLNIVFFIIGLLFLKKALPLSKKIKELKKEQNLFD